MSAAENDKILKEIAKLLSSGLKTTTEPFPKQKRSSGKSSTS